MSERIGDVLEIWFDVALFVLCFVVCAAIPIGLVEAGAILGGLWWIPIGIGIFLSSVTTIAIAVAPR